MIVYKYLPPNRTTVLENRLVRFTQAPALNDPFETTPNMQPLEASFRKYAIRRIEETNYGSVIDYVRDRSRVGSLVKGHLDEFLRINKQKYVILSLSKINNNLLMWAHYCDSHRGLVLGFDGDHAFFQTRRLNAFSVLSEVTYSDKRPMMPAVENWDGTQQQIEQALDSVNIAEIMFYTKSEDWKYEQELRMVANPKLANHAGKCPDGQDLYLFEFPKECLKEVIFGIRMPSDERRRLVEIVRDRYDGVKLYEAVLSPETFDLTIIPIH